MAWPLIIQYIESVTNPFGLFRTLEGIECMKDAYDSPTMSVGGNAVTFKINLYGNTKALKCHTKQKRNTDAIYAYLKDKHDPLIHPYMLLKDEIYVYFSEQGKYYDVILSDWCDGKSLDYEIRRCLHTGDKKQLKIYSETFNKFALEILEREWAHGDIKPENIFVLSDNTFKLIDTDAMYIPTLSSSDETGTYNYRHPLKKDDEYGPYIDDYPLLLIAVSLYALSLSPDLYKKYNTQGSLLLNPEEILNDTSRCYDEIADLFARAGNWKYIELLHKLKSHSVEIKGINKLFKMVTQIDSTKEDRLDSFVENGKWGFKDNAHKTIIPPVFDSVLEFSEGLACVKLNGYNHYIDQHGQVVINCSNFETIKPFHDEKAEVIICNNKIIIDKQGNII